MSLCGRSEETYVCKKKKIKGKNIYVLIINRFLHAHHTWDEYSQTWSLNTDLIDMRCTVKGNNN